VNFLCFTECFGTRVLDARGYTRVLLMAWQCVGGRLRQLPKSTRELLRSVCTCRVTCAFGTSRQNDAARVVILGHVHVFGTRGFSDLCEMFHLNLLLEPEICF
jgi:IS5 family transposase